jgi:hypothetical protein
MLVGRSLSHVKENYGVPVKRGMRVGTFQGEGVVTCGDGAYVRVRVDGQKHSGSYHPLSRDYLDGVEPEARLARHNARTDAWNDRLNGRITQEEYVARMEGTDRRD